MLNDFPDAFSPMLVKELRQGMRTRLFVAIFILLQGVLALALLTSVFVAGGEAGMAGAGEAVSSLFWWILVIILLIVMPQRGFNALWSEQKAGTLDLVLISRLTSWRIAFGKWAALVSQSALLVTAVLPYVILRYFLGGSNPVVDLLWVGAVFALSCVFTAIAVGFSAHRWFLVRGMVAFGLLVLALMASSSLFALVEGWQTPFQGATVWWGALGGLGLGAFASYYALDMGAALIAPAAENHAIRKRLSGLGVLLALIGALYLGADEDAIIFIIMVVGAVVCLDAITETPNVLPSIVAPFARRGFVGRVAGRFFTPGWHTGILYLLLFSAIAFVGIYLLSSPYLRTWQLTGPLIGLVGALVFPLAVVQFFFPRATPIFGVYVMVMCSTAIYLLLVTIMAEASRQDEIYFFACFLPLAMAFPNSTLYELGEPIFWLATTSTLLSFLIVLVRSRPVFRKMREIERGLARQ